MAWSSSLEYACMLRPSSAALLKGSNATGTGSEWPLQALRCGSSSATRAASCKALAQAWLVVYRDPKKYFDLYQLGEELTDLEDAFRLWRFRHVTTVERIIGFKRGTGGTSGVGYLRKMLDVVLFPEIWKLRTDL